ncbi:L-threonine ammonia-lyase [Paraperlucidibaca baekdonensis]|uniref:L-threonine dehydratase n=1 Tax=Paraperlucidibaca baekdonensis TaxID=748120 RepID=A0A3E0H9W3_9GAMM|nr:threonine ammonia-lyase, biosynthetic [Paraperlucidibaca baekdonensis]REH39982.1 L-threonine ammonia-lyase [Paraperlucidibaca baekdonensis]
MLDAVVKRILQARVYDVAIESPLDEAAQLSKRLKNRVLIKREDLQPVFSFKLRGAYNKIRLLPEADRARGIIAASAGNHAQGVALATKKLGIKGVIVMPQTTPDIKVNAVRALGAQAVLHGDNYDEAFAHAQQLMAEKGYTFVHPFDDPDTIAGQGTVAMEILRQHSGEIDAVFIPCGGGGLMAGMAAYIKHVRPEIRVIAVEAEDSACLAAAMQAGQRVTLPSVGLFADGVAVKLIGEHTFAIAQHCVDEVITCTTDEICAAIKDVFDECRSIAEPAGALSIAGLKKYVQREGVTQQTLVAINSGANMNFDRLRHIAERTELGEGREAVLAVTIPEKAGAFKAFCQAIGKRNVTEFNYRYSSAAEAHVFVGVSLKPGLDARLELVGSLRKKGYEVLDLSDDEMAKLHTRHLVGGHAGLTDERLFRFEFPERPGALMAFLSELGGQWNISLFHYRNHGAAYGRVLIGLQLGDKPLRALIKSLEAVGYPYSDESDNPAYQLFLR